MNRVKWKGPYVSNKLLKKFIKKQNDTNSLYSFELNTKSRSSTITPLFIGGIINVHNGKNFTKVLITEDMVGKKLGEFSPTRKKFSFKKKKLK